MEPSFWRSFMLPMIDGITTRLDASAPSRIRARITRLRERVEQANTRAEQVRVERSFDSLVKRESAVASAISEYLGSVMPPGLQSPFEKQILIKTMIGDITPRRLTKRCS
jgi:hypothetical protein